MVTEIPPVLIDIIPGITEGGAIIIGLIVLAILILWFFGKALAKKLEVALSEMKEVKSQVANDHSVNLRDDLDSKDTVQHAKLDQIVDTINRRFDAMNDRVTGLDRRLTGIDNRLNMQEH